MVISCRFYEQKYPEIDDVVMVNVRSIADMGVYVDLLEYNNMEGMILLCEYSFRDFQRRIKKLFKVGRTEPVVVIRVDKDKGYIDVSKKRVSKKGIERCTEKYSKAKAVNSIIRHVAEILGIKTNEELEDLYRKTAWYFEKQGTAYDFFKQSVAEPSLLNSLDLDENTKAVLVENIQRKLTQQSARSGRISSVHVSPTRELMLSRRLLGQAVEEKIKGSGDADGFKAQGSCIEARSLENRGQPLA